MIDLKAFKDMDRRNGRPDQMAGGSGFFSRDELGDDSPHPTMRPPLELPSPEGGDREHEIDIFGMDDIDDQEQEDESAFSRLSNKISKEPGVRNPDAVAASIGRKKYGNAGMAAKSAAGRRR
jgi:hypothetical protein